MILIAVGANLPGPDRRPPLATCRIAVEALRAIDRLRLQSVSPWYLTAPVPPSGQPDYVNAVVRLEATGSAPDPAWLLAALQRIEQHCGRLRGAVNAARTLDLDIIAIGDLIRAAPDPILPHPRAHLRRFVLQPLADVAPDWVHPTLRRSAASLLATLDPAGVTLLTPAGPGLTPAGPGLTPAGSGTVDRP
jgi:2-amino-4-hydroxy-6-hydroxymethyldihydropteridine diphosphokinase